MEFVNAFILCTAALLLACRQSAALSFELCDSYGAEWVTDSPHLSGVYPFYSLIFSCNSGLNIEGKMVDACLGNGAACGQAAADAYCKYIGFDGAVADQFQTAPSDQPTRAVSGEWCVNAGSYQALGALNRTQFEALNATTAANGPRCQKLDSATCYRSRQTLGKAFAGIQAAPTNQRPAPRATAPQQADHIQQAGTAGAIPGPNAAPAGIEVGGRRLRGWTLRTL